MCPLAETLDGGEDLVGGLDPFVGFRIFVVRRDEGCDVGLQLGGGAVHTTLQLLARQFREPAFDLIDPGCRCGREMHMPVRPAGKPGLDLRGLSNRMTHMYPKYD